MVLIEKFTNSPWKRFYRRFFHFKRLSIGWFGGVQIFSGEPYEPRQANDSQRR
jgi:hypothetical protein